MISNHRSIIFALFISAFFIHSAQSDCQVVINEVNVNDPKKPEKGEFIELKSACDDSLALRGYKLIGLNCKASSGTIELVVTLWNARCSSGFFTIGGSEVSNANMKVPNDYIKFRNSFNRGIAAISNFLVNGNKGLSAIGLLFDSEKLNPFDDIVLTKNKNFIKIDDKIIELLKKYLVDIVVYGERKECDKCALFEIIHNDFANKKYTLREIPTNMAKSDITLNRCALEAIGFLPEKFKLGKPTPSAENDCSGPHFILEDIILDILPPMNAHVIYQDEYDDQVGATCSNQPQCSTSIQETDYFQITRRSIEQSIETANLTSTNSLCTPLKLYPEGGNTAQLLDQENSRKRKMGVETDYSEEFEWKTTKYFR